MTQFRINKTRRANRNVVVQAHTYRLGGSMKQWCVGIVICATVEGVSQSQSRVVWDRR
jgi:hypothetical protein